MSTNHQLIIPHLVVMPVSIRSDVLRTAAFEDAVLDESGPLWSVLITQMAVCPLHACFYDAQVMHDVAAEFA